MLSAETSRACPLTGKNSMDVSRNTWPAPLHLVLRPKYVDLSHALDQSLTLIPQAIAQITDPV
jgi:hypothetical protein